MTPRRQVEHLVSAGGVVYRTLHGEVEVVICGRTIPSTWSLPKGTPEPDESIEQTAIREVTEETGLEVEIDRFIDNIDYWFVNSERGAHYHKTVHFYLMSAKGGSIFRHDPEFDVVQWVPGGDALKSLTYVNETNIVEKALGLVSEHMI